MAISGYRHLSDTHPVKLHKSQGLMGGIQSSPSAQTCSDKTLRTQTESLERKASACGFKEPCQREGQACRPGSCLLWVWETHTQRLQRPTPSCLRWVGGIKERKQRGTEITQRWGRKSDTKLWVVTPDFYSSPRRQKLLESQMWSGFSLMQQTMERMLLQTVVLW